MADGQPGRLGFATVDLDRERRQGLPEAVYAPGKTVDEIAEIVRELLNSCSSTVLVTRIDQDRARQVQQRIELGAYDPAARLLYWRPATSGAVSVAIVTAGTADGQVAAEALRVAVSIGLKACLICDVGVAGIHRVFARLDEILAADIVVVIAGMEGALASVIGGFVAGPVIAVPTSTGYGASLEGVTALLAMLSSCAAGITVVNIDSGFGAALAAHRLAERIKGVTIRGGSAGESAGGPGTAPSRPQ